MKLGNILRIQIKNSVNNCSMKLSLSLFSLLSPPLPPLSPFPVCLRKQTNKKFRWNLSPRARQRDPGCSSSSAIICFLQFHLPLHLSRPLLTPASVLSGQEGFPMFAEGSSFSTVTAQAWKWLESCHQFALFLSSLRSPGGGEACKEQHSAAC